MTIYIGQTFSLRIQGREEPLAQNTIYRRIGANRFR